MTASAPVRARDRLVFDDEAWQLAVQGDAPLVLHDRGEWLMEHPFTPPADAWLVLPLGTGTRRLGVVIGGADALPAVESGAAAVLRLLGDLLGAGIAAARLRQELAAHGARARAHAARRRGARRARAGPRARHARARAARLRPGEEVAEASRGGCAPRSRSAHRTVRSRLTGMIAAPALGGLRPALEELCDALLAPRGARSSCAATSGCPSVAPRGRGRRAARAVGGAHQRRAARRRRRTRSIEARATGGRLELVVQRRRPRVRRRRRAVGGALRAAADARAGAGRGRRARGRQRAGPRHPRRAGPTRGRCSSSTSLAEHLEAEACPHLAVFLRSADELPGVLASFYALGVRRGGWLAHRALPGRRRPRARAAHRGGARRRRAGGRGADGRRGDGLQPSGGGVGRPVARGARRRARARLHRPLVRALPGRPAGGRPRRACSASSASGTGCRATGRW